MGSIGNVALDCGFDLPVFRVGGVVGTLAADDYIQTQCCQLPSECGEFGAAGGGQHHTSSAINRISRTRRVL